MKTLAQTCAFENLWKWLQAWASAGGAKRAFAHPGNWD